MALTNDEQGALDQNACEVADRLSRTGRFETQPPGAQSLTGVERRNPTAGCQPFSSKYRSDWSLPYSAHSTNTPTNSVNTER